MQCDGCGRKIRAGYAQNNEQTVVFCLNCHHVANQDRFKAMQYNLAIMNDLSGNIDEIFGLPRRQRYKIPQDNYILGTSTNNNFNISNSAIGVVNSGIVDTLNAALNDVAINDVKLAKQILIVAEKIGKSVDLSNDQREQALEALIFLAEQSKRDAESRNKSLIKSASSILRDTVGIAADLAAIAPPIVSIISKIS